MPSLCRRVALALPLLIIACGDDPTAPADDSPLPGDLAGDISRERFVIPAGATHTVKGNLRVFADDEIRIDGTLLMDDGIDVVLTAPTVTLNGDMRPAVEPEESASASMLRSVGLASLPFEQARGSGPCDLKEIRVIVSGQHATVSSVTANRILIAGARFIDDEDVTLTIKGSLDAPDGESASTKDMSGCPGGSILIGTAGAQQEIRESTGRQIVSPLTTVTLEAGTMIQAGRGGHSFNITSAAEGVVIDRTLHLVNTSHGGDGGSVEIEAEHLLLHGPGIRAGNGGNGGHILAPSSGSGLIPIRARDGQALLERGDNLIAQSGDGGNGGFIVLKAANVEGFLSREHADFQLFTGAGLGGHPGGIEAVGAGNGGPAGAGGDATLLLGKQGRDGRLIVHNAGTTTEEEKYWKISGTWPTARLEDGGNGGASPTDLLPGGAGGNVEVYRSDSLEFALETSDTGNGGEGFSHCQPPLVGPGTAGGAGGTIWTTPHFERNSFLSPTSFFGGNGGDGTSPGAGGAAGKHGPVAPDLTKGSLEEFPDRAGKPGALCATAAPSKKVGFLAVPQGETRVALFQNEGQTNTELPFQLPAGADPRSNSLAFRGDGSMAVLGGIVTDDNRFLIDAYLLPPGGGMGAPLTNVGEVVAVDFCPNGTFLYLLRDGGGLWAQDQGASAPRQVRAGNLGAPRCSPDGTHAVLSEDARTSSMDPPEFRVALVNLETGGTQFLTSGSIDETPTFTADGSGVLFIRYPLGGSSTSLRRIDLQSHAEQTLFTFQGDALNVEDGGEAGILVNVSGRAAWLIDGALEPFTTTPQLSVNALRIAPEAIAAAATAARAR